MERPRLRDNRKLASQELYPLGEIPSELIRSIGGGLVYLLAIGRKDISGNDWGDIFANAIGGTHLNSPIGIADVVLNKTAWSMKTVKSSNPFTTKSIRLISGRCSPDYSYGITNPHEDIQRTGRAVLGIWNERINIANDNYNPVRTAILIRSSDMLSYTLFEEDNRRFRTADFIWESNPNGNLIGKDIETGLTRFTWQPHGSQLTIHTHVPKNAIKFVVKAPPIISKSDVMNAIGFDESWINIL